MSYADKALWIIERNSTQALTLDGIAAACGVSRSHLAHAFCGLLQLEVQPRQYAVFEHRGHVSTIYETYRCIWNEALPATGRTAADAPIIERHNSTFDPRTGEGGLTLWIPLNDGGAI